MKRSALAATTLAVLALTACTGQSGAATPSPTPVVTPTALPTSTATPALTPQPVESGTTTTPSAAPSATRSRSRAAWIASGSTIAIWSPMKASLGSSTASATKAGSAARPPSVVATASITAR